MILALILISLYILQLSDASDCPDNWTVYEGSCYLFGHMNLTFVEAEHYCQQHQGHLVHIETAAENMFLKNHLIYLKGEMWWIGLTDEDVEGVWKWYGSNEKATFTDWTPGNPDDWLDNEDCAEFDMRAYYNARWNDSRCYLRLLQICEKQAGICAEMVG